MNAWLTALGVALLSIGSFWMLHRLELEERNAAARRVHEPDYYIDKMVRRTLGTEGQLANVLRAEHLERVVDRLAAGGPREVPADACDDQVLLFVLLHEMPETVRRATLCEAVRGIE